MDEMNGYVLAIRWEGKKGNELNGSNSTWRGE